MEKLNIQTWWQTDVIYQVYPRSFQDSNEDGVGDLNGIVSRLDYLSWLGIGAIWISPIYPSPMADYGYDISNYTDIHPLFGTLKDFDSLLTEAHKRNIKVILDLVPNHTSDQHPWFIESRSSRENPKRDWYLWCNAKQDGTVPNNWLSVFGGPAWEWDEPTQQYYYHAFLKQQPDLNWRNPEVQQAMLDVMRFWLKRGVDGFRVDVLWHLIKDAQWRDNPVNPNYKIDMSTYEQLLPVYSTDQPEVHPIVREMRSLADEYGERVFIGEIYLPIHKLVTYYGPNNDGANLPFNFLLISLPWHAREIASSIDQYEAALPPGAWPNWVLGNHDQTRIASRVGLQQARIAAILLFTLRGTPTVYYGDEISMRDVPIPKEEVQDPQGLNMPEKNLSRDPARTPMQWTDGLFAGFSNVKPWLRLDRLYTRENVEKQKDQPHSMLTLYKRLINLRSSESAFLYGNYKPVYSDNQMIVFLRVPPEGNRFLVALNLTHKPCYFIPEHERYAGTVVLSTFPEMEGTRVENNFSLSGDEGIVVKLD